MPTNFDFASLQTAQTEQAAVDFGEYQKMLREIAAGTCKRSKAEILAVLKAVDRDVNLLEQDVKKRTERDEMIAETKKVKEYEAEHKKADEQLDRLIADSKKVEEAFEEKKWPLVYKCDALQKKLRDIDGFRRKLIVECDDDRLIDERSQLEHQLNDPAEANLYRKQRELANEIGTAEQTLKTLPITRNHHDESQTLKARLKELKARYENSERQKTEITKRKNKLKEAVREVESRMALA